MNFLYKKKKQIYKWWNDSVLKKRNDQTKMGGRMKVEGEEKRERERGLGRVCVHGKLLEECNRPKPPFFKKKKIVILLHQLKLIILLFHSISLTV